jgi:hypothetical protein
MPLHKGPHSFGVFRRGIDVVHQGMRQLMDCEKLIRRIDRADPDEACFIAALKKTGTIPRNLPVSQK